MFCPLFAFAAQAAMSVGARVSGIIRKIGVEAPSLPCRDSHRGANAAPREALAVRVRRPGDKVHVPRGAYTARHGMLAPVVPWTSRRAPPHSAAEEAHNMPSGRNR